MATMIQRSSGNYEFFYFPDLNTQEGRILDWVINFPQTRELFETAALTFSSKGFGPYKVECVEQTSAGFAGECNFVERKITLQKGMSDAQALSIFVFELTNAVAHEEFLELECRARAGLIASADQYAKENERIEHKGTRVHYCLMKLAIDTWAWPKEVERYSLESFEKAWEYKKNDPHAEYYRKYFRDHFTSLKQVEVTENKSTEVVVEEDSEFMKESCRDIKGSTKKRSCIDRVSAFVSSFIENCMDDFCRWALMTKEYGP